MDCPLVSICCLTYNHEKYIQQTLDGFLMQKTEYEFEVLIHDDASTDNTAEIIKEYQKKYPDIIKPIYQVENQYSKGVIINKEFQFSRAKGKYIALCEGDDYWTDENKLQMQISYMEQNPQCSCTFHAALLSSNEVIIGNDRHYEEECDIPTEEIVQGDGAYCATASLVFRTKYALEYPKFRLISDVGDYPLQILLAAKGSVHYFPDTMSVYRCFVEGSWTQRNWSAEKENIHRRVKHIHNKIEVLQEFDKEYNKKYHYSVVDRVMQCKMDLYSMRHYPVHKLYRDVKELRIKEEKWKYKRKFVKASVKRYFPKFITFLKNFK